MNRLADDGLKTEWRMALVRLLQSVMPEARLFLFGSRASGRHRPGSDIDIAIDAGHPLTLAQRSVIDSRFEDSNVPYVLDLVDLQTVDGNFRKRIEERAVRWA